eukprot:3650075-Ditylum_brightwellii.AAC.1
MEGFTYDTPLDLNMGYHRIKILPKFSTLCTIVLPWDIKEVHVYIDDLLLITNRDWESHLEKLDEVLDRLKCTGLKVNAQIFFFGCQELEYLCYWVTRQGIKPL